MSILVDHQLRYIGPDILDPFDPAMVQPSSIDLRLGTSFRVARHHSLAHVDLADVPPEDEITELVEVPLYREECPSGCDAGVYRPPDQECLTCCGTGYRINPAGSIVIHPGEAMLGSTLERITVPSNLVMCLHGKSSLSRLFLVPHTQAGYFDPGWSGVGTLELVNHSRVPIKLRPGLKICQSRWETLDELPTDPYGSAKAGSHYQGADGVGGSRYQG